MKRLLLICAFLLIAIPVGAQCHHPHRSSAVAHRFKVMTGYPYGRPGYIIDHIVPLECCGPDTPSNMQWQTRAAAKAKDRWELKECRHDQGCCR